MTMNMFCLSFETIRLKTGHEPTLLTPILEQSKNRNELSSGQESHPQKYVLTYSMYSRMVFWLAELSTEEYPRSKLICSHHPATGHGNIFRGCASESTPLCCLLLAAPQKNVSQGWQAAVWAMIGVLFAVVLPWIGGINDELPPVPGFNLKNMS